MKNLILYLISFISNHGKCRHTRALLNANEGYCPDCGEYLKKYYYVLRCKCCHHKKEGTRAVFGEVHEIVPSSKYCPECGAEEFYIEKYEKLNFTDVNYAIEVKENYDITEASMSKTTVWIEEPNSDSEFSPNTDTAQRNRGEKTHEKTPPKAIEGGRTFLLQTSFA